MVGEQCEAIVKFPSLMDKFPFPVMINTALLKLADVFSAPATANLLRLHIFRVFQLSHRHLGKVASVDELVRRFSLVSHSNDPVARALTLRFVVAPHHFPFILYTVVLTPPPTECLVVLAALWLNVRTYFTGCHVALSSIFI